MKFTRKQILQTLFFLGIGIFLVYWQINQLSQTEKTSAINSLKQANYFWVLLACVISVMSHWLRGLRWTMLIKTADETVKPINAFYAVMIGYLANGFLPRFGEIIRCVVLAKKDKVNFEKLVGTVFAERLFDFAFLIFIVAVTVFLQFNLLSSFIYDKLLDPFVNQIIKILPNVLLTITLFLGIIGLLWLIWYLLIKKMKFIQKIKGKWSSIKVSFLEGLQTIVKLKNKPLFIGYSFGIWICYFSMAYLIFNSFEETKHLGIDAGLGVLTSGSLALIIPTPGGLGSYHEFVSRTLQLYGVYGGIGVSLSWLIWLTNYSVVLVFGLLSFLLIGFKNK